MARQRHPGVRFEQASLPGLAALKPASFRNLMCETVIMHLPLPTITAAVNRLIDILVPDGTLYLSWLTGPPPAVVVTLPRTI